jgi:hypothetical protein
MIKQISSVLSPVNSVCHSSWSSVSQRDGKNTLPLVLKQEFQNKGRKELSINPFITIAAMGAAAVTKLHP